jgi:hypothetical protein
VKVVTWAMALEVVVGRPRVVVGRPGVVVGRPGVVVGRPRVVGGDRNRFKVPVYMGIS